MKLCRNLEAGRLKRPNFMLCCLHKGAGRQPGVSERRSVYLLQPGWLVGSTRQKGSIDFNGLVQIFFGIIFVLVHRRDSHAI